MKAVIHKTGAIGEVLGIERREGKDYVYFENGYSCLIGEVGFLTPYENFAEDKSWWADFRREAAKDILCSLVWERDSLATPHGKRVGEVEVSLAIYLADELIRQLKED